MPGWCRGSGGATGWPGAFLGAALYGVEGPDRVNNSDPFGLCPPKSDDTSDCPSGPLEDPYKPKPETPLETPLVDPVDLPAMAVGAGEVKAAATVAAEALASKGGAAAVGRAATALKSVGATIVRAVSSSPGQFVLGVAKGWNVVDQATGGAGTGTVVASSKAYNAGVYVGAVARVGVKYFTGH